MANRNKIKGWKKGLIAVGAGLAGFLAGGCNVKTTADASYTKPLRNKYGFDQNERIRGQVGVEVSGEKGGIRLRAGYGEHKEWYSGFTLKSNMYNARGGFFVNLWNKEGAPEYVIPAQTPTEGPDDNLEYKGLDEEAVRKDEESVKSMERAVGGIERGAEGYEAPKVDKEPVDYAAPKVEERPKSPAIRKSSPVKKYTPEEKAKAIKKFKDAGLAIPEYLREPAPEPEPEDIPEPEAYFNPGYGFVHITGMKAKAQSKWRHLIPDSVEFGLDVTYDIEDAEFNNPSRGIYLENREKAWGVSPYFRANWKKFYIESGVNIRDSNESGDDVDGKLEYFLGAGLKW